MNLHEAVELGKYATELGYDSLSAVTPFYYKFSFPEIKHYYDTIIAETGNNMIVYSIPFLTGVNMGIEQFGELYKNPESAWCEIYRWGFLSIRTLEKSLSKSPHLGWF